MNNEFSLKISSRDGDCISFEHSSFICNYREKILTKVSLMGGTIISNFEVELPTKENLDSLLLFISLLRSDVFAITVNRKKFIAWISKTPPMKKHWDILENNVKIFHGTPTLDGFDFENISKAKDFMNCLIEIIL